MSRMPKKEVGQLIWGERKLGSVSQITGAENEELEPKAGRKFIHSFTPEYLLSPVSPKVDAADAQVIAGPDIARL